MRVHGRLRVPGDKSISHRALILSALAEGESRIRGILQSADVHSTAGVLKELGVDVPELTTDFVLRGVGLQGLRVPTEDLQCGNSGTTTRLMSGVGAALPFTTRFVGDASLSRRPMHRVSDPLGQMGASFDFEHGDGLPMSIRGGDLHSLDWQSSTASAQVKSAILLAGLVGRVPVSVTEPVRSRDHTERMLTARGARVAVDGLTVRFDPVNALRHLDVDVPADPSSAAFFAALAALADGGHLLLEHVCVNPTRAGFFDVLREMGASVRETAASLQGGEPTANIHVGCGELRGVTITGDRVPSMIDEISLIACLGTRAVGDTVITGAAELRVKESDRITATVANLQAIGAEAAELPDGMRIVGSGKPLGGRVVTHGDHRIAMAFGVLGSVPGNDIEIDDRACVAVSYPDFWEDLLRVHQH